MGFKKSAKMIVKYTFKSPGAMGKTIFLMFLGSFFSVLIPRITETILNGVDPSTDFTLSLIELILWFLAILVLGLIGTLFSAASRYQSGVVSTNAVYFLRKDIYRAINRQSFSFFDKTETGQLISRATSDIELTGPLFGMGITFSIQASITILMTMIMVTLMVPVLSLILWISIPLYIIIILIYSLKLKSPFLKSRESFGDLTTIIRENILGSQVVRIFNSVGKENEKFVKENRKFLDFTVESIKYQSVLMQVSRFFVGLILIIGFFIAGRMVFDGQIIIPTFLAFIAYLAIIASPLWMMVNVLVQFVQADAALTRINEVIENTPEIKEIKDAISAKNLKGKSNS